MLLAFDECVLDVDRRELHRNGALVHVRTKVFDVLDYLIANRDRVLSRDELLTQVWPGLNVSDGNLSATIRSVRLAIGDDGSDPRLIKTLRGKGFRFVAEVTRQDASGREISGGTTAAHARDDTLSIAVLPFTNLNNDPTLDYLADGLADDITTALVRFKAFTVISQRTSFQFRGPVNDIGQIGAILQVDYILEGRVRCDADVFHATAQLTHAPTTRHLWAENFDGRIDELFALRDGITQKDRHQNQTGNRFGRNPAGFSSARWRFARAGNGVAGPRLDGQGAFGGRFYALRSVHRTGRGGRGPRSTMPPGLVDD